MKRSALIIAVLGATILVPISAQADAATPTTHHGKSMTEAARVQARQAARSALNSALSQAQNGRDLAFADANASLMQALQAAGKDQSARSAARAAYKSAAMGIITVYKQSVFEANQNFKAAVAATK